MLEKLSSVEIVLFLVKNIPFWVKTTYPQCYSQVDNLSVDNCFYC